MCYPRVYCEDFSGWSVHWGYVEDEQKVAKSGNPGAGPLAALSAVPEPNSLAMLALGATGTLAYRRRRTYQIGGKICKGESRRRKTIFKKIRRSDKTYN